MFKVLTKKVKSAGRALLTSRAGMAMCVNTHSKVGRSLIQKWATRESMQS